MELRNHLYYIYADIPGFDEDYDPLREGSKNPNFHSAEFIFFNGILLEEGWYSLHESSGSLMTYKAAQIAQILDAKAESCHILPDAIAKYLRAESKSLKDLTADDIFIIVNEYFEDISFGPLELEETDDIPPFDLSKKKEPSIDLFSIPAHDLQFAIEERRQEFPWALIFTDTELESWLMSNGLSFDGKAKNVLIRQIHSWIGTPENAREFILETLFQDIRGEIDTDPDPTYKLEFSDIGVYQNPDY